MVTNPSSNKTNRVYSGGASWWRKSTKRSKADPVMFPRLRTYHLLEVGSSSEPQEEGNNYEDDYRYPPLGGYFLELTDDLFLNRRRLNNQYKNHDGHNNHPPPFDKKRPPAWIGPYDGQNYTTIKQQGNDLCEWTLTICF